MLRGWLGHRLGTWLVKEQCISLWTCWLSLGGIILLSKQTDPSFLKCLPPLFVLLKLLWDPGGAVVQRVHGAVQE